MVTRGAAQSAETAAQLRTLGATPVVIPLIQFAPLDSAREPLAAALANIRAYDWILFTSQNAVHFSMEMLRQQHARHDGLTFGPPRVAAVGPKTAASLRREGVRVDVVPSSFIGDKLVEVLGDVDGERILLPRAKKGNPDVVRRLRERGATVDEIALYDTVAAEISAADRAELNRGYDVILFASPSAVKSFCEQVGEVTGLVGCIGRVTGGSAEKHHLPVNILPEKSTMNGLIHAVVQYYQVTHE